jgi:glycosyltransferase involved in cell wall biosynthesis
MRVAIVVERGRGAGAVASPLGLALGLERSGVRVRFVCEPGSAVESMARAAGLEVHTVTLERKQMRANARRLVTLFDEHPVDLVNCQTKRDRSALSYAAFRYPRLAPLVITWRGMPRTFTLKNVAQSLTARRTIAVSRAVGEELVRRGTPRARLAVVPNGLVVERVDRHVSAAEVEAWRARIGWTPAERTVGVVSRPKDHHVVLAALAQVQVPVRLVFAGVDPDSEIGRQAAAVGAPHAVVCVPFDQAIRPLYELLEVSLLPSSAEGISQAMLESMALGKPMLASDTGGTPDVIRDGVNGRLLPPYDPAAWARALEEVLRDPAYAARLAEAGRRTAREEFSLERTVARTIAVYEDVLRER